MEYFTGSENVFLRLFFKLHNIFHGIAFLDGVAFLREFFSKKVEGENGLKGCAEVEFLQVSTGGSWNFNGSPVDDTQS